MAERSTLLGCAALACALAIAPGLSTAASSSGRQPLGLAGSAAVTGGDEAKDFRTDIVAGPIGSIINFWGTCPPTPEPGNDQGVFVAFRRADDPNAAATAYASGRFDTGLDGYFAGALVAPFEAPVGHYALVASCGTADTNHIDFSAPFEVLPDGAARQYSPELLAEWAASRHISTIDIDIEAGPPGTAISVHGTCAFTGQVIAGQQAHAALWRHIEGTSNEPFKVGSQTVPVATDGTFAMQFIVPLEAPIDEYRFSGSCFLDDQAFGDFSLPFEVLPPGSPTRPASSATSTTLPAPTTTSRPTDGGSGGTTWFVAVLAALGAAALGLGVTAFARRRGRAAPNAGAPEEPE